jgi:uncharacterized protein RhaS with RHS repeats
LTQITTRRADLSVEDTIAFSYDAKGNRLSAADSDSSLAFTYDGLDRVLTASTVAAAGAVQPAVTLTGTYDAVGNRTQLQAASGGLPFATWTAAFDRVGRMLSLC